LFGDLRAALGTFGDTQKRIMN